MTRLVRLGERGEVVVRCRAQFARSDRITSRRGMREIFFDYGRPANGAILEMDVMGLGGAGGAARDWDYCDHRVASVSRAAGAGADCKEICGYTAAAGARAVYRYGFERVRLLPLAT